MKNSLSVSILEDDVGKEILSVLKNGYLVDEFKEFNSGFDAIRFKKGKEYQIMTIPYGYIDGYKSKILD